MTPADELAAVVAKWRKEAEDAYDISTRYGNTYADDVQPILAELQRAQRQLTERDALEKIIEHCKFTSGWVVIDEIRKLAEAALLSAPTPDEPPIEVQFGPISEKQKEYIDRGELPPAEPTQRKWREIMDDAMRHIKRAITDLQVVERDWKMDADALKAVVPKPHDPDWRDHEHPPE
jgi:hypothetical protein